MSARSLTNVLFRRKLLMCNLNHFCWQCFTKFILSFCFFPTIRLHTKISLDKYRHIQAKLYINQHWMNNWMEIVSLKYEKVVYWLWKIHNESETTSKNSAKHRANQVCLRPETTNDWINEYECDLKSEYILQLKSDTKLCYTHQIGCEFCTKTSFKHFD